MKTPSRKSQLSIFGLMIIALFTGWLLTVSGMDVEASSEIAQPAVTDPPTATATETPYTIPSLTPTETPTTTSTPTITGTATLTGTPTNTPTPGCDMIIPGNFIVTGGDGLQFTVTNNNVAAVTLTGTTLTWTDYYDPEMLVDYFRFDLTQYWDGDGFDSPTTITSTVSFPGSSIADWTVDFDGYGVLYGQTHTIGPFAIELTFNNSPDCIVSASIPSVHSTIFKPTEGQIITSIAQTNFETRAYDSGVGITNGSGIDRVHIVILDPSNNVVVNRTDSSKPYCAWGNFNPCPLMSAAQWDTLPNGQYTMIAWARSTNTASWSPPAMVTFVLERVLPTATPTSTATPTRTPTITLTPLPSETPTPTDTLIPTSTDTDTPTPTATETPSPTPTETPGTIEGVILLQGRTDFSGTRVMVYSNGNLLGDGLTDQNGAFSFSLYSGTYDLVVESALYLDSLRTGIIVELGTTNTLPTLTLLGGDSNDSDTINILDLAFIGAHYGLNEGDPGWSPAADINGDGTVNLLDLTIAASNFRKSSPLPW